MRKTQLAAKSVGADLKKVLQWVEDGIAVIDPILAQFNPSLASIFMDIEEGIESVLKIQGLTSAQLQAFITGTATRRTVLTYDPQN